MTKISKAEVYVAAILLFLLILAIYLKSWLRAVYLALRLPGPTALPLIGNAALITDSKNQQVDSLEEYTRRNNLRIYGIPQSQHEDTNELLINLFKDKLGVDVKEYNIDRSHRLPGKNASGPAPLIIKFNCYKVRDAIYKNKSKFKGTKIIIKEDLTKVRLNLYRAAVDKFTSKGVWTRDEMVHIGNNCYKKYGRIFRVWISVMPMVFIMEPKDIQTIIGNSKHTDKSFIYTLLHNFIGDGLISRNGIRWKRHRKLIQPSFHINALQLYISRFSKSAELHLSKLKAADNTEINITYFINDCVLDILHDTVLGIPLDDIVLKSKSPFRKGVITLPTRIRKPWFLIESIYQLTSVAENELKQKSKLQEYTKKILEIRRKTTSRIDHSLVDAFIEISKNDPEFTDDDIINELCTFMLAGQDSVAAAVAFALYYLAKHQDVQEKACSELQDIFGNSARPMCFEDVNRMRYLEQCIKETLRLCPSVPIFSRTLSDDVVLDDYTLPAGCNVLISPYVTHRLAHIYENPENFEPARFAPENCEDLHPFAYLPFSAGPRNCIGFKFGLLEIKAILATFLLAYKLSPCPERDFSFFYRVTLRAKGGIWLRLQKK